MKLKLHMKSGKTLVQRGVKDCKYSYNSTSITALTITTYWWARQTILVPSIDLSQIEAITIHII